MLFTLSKVFWAVASPGNFLLLLLLTGFALKKARPRASQLLQALVTFSLLLIASLRVGEWGARPLEQRFPVPAMLPEKLDGIVVLGGSISPSVSVTRQRPALTDHAERLTSVVALARRYPEARILFTGGATSVTRQEQREAPWARAFLEEMGVDAGRLLLEGESRNTFENAIYAKRLIQPMPEEKWLLVTSAMHMARAIGCFRKAGWPVIPYPVDFLTEGERFSIDFDLVKGLRFLSSSSREWTGLLAYRALGRTSSLFPGPADPETASLLATRP